MPKPGRERPLARVSNSKPPPYASAGSITAGLTCALGHCERRACPEGRRRRRARPSAGCAGIAPTSPKIAVGGSNPRQHWLGTHPQGCVVCAQTHRALAH